MSTFYERFNAQTEATGGVLCVGLDPDLERLPTGYERNEGGTIEFLTDVVSATADLTAAYKINTAFFEAMGSKGWEALEQCVSMVRRAAPRALVIADAKRGDIGNTARMYARAFFEQLNCDAVTVSPYMGLDTIVPFLSHPGKAAFVLCLTSNPGAADFELEGVPPLFLRVAEGVARLQKKCDGTAGLVVGATRSADDVRRVRVAAPDAVFLIPGVGEQGGDLKATLGAAGRRVLINASRSILYAGSDRVDAAKAARMEAEKMVLSMRASFAE